MIKEKQLYDELAPFYPITDINAVVAGELVECADVEEIDLFDCLVPNFKTFQNVFKVIKNKEFNIASIIFDVDKIPTATIGKGVTILASNVPWLFGTTKKNIVLATITDDISCYAKVLWDPNGEIKLINLPIPTVSSIDNKVICDYPCEMTSISGSRVYIY